MTIGMYQSRILPARRPRRYGLLQVADVTRYGAQELQRWIAGVDAVSLEVELLNGVDLTACDPPASGDWDLTATPSSDVFEFRSFSSIVRAQCGTLSGPDTLDAMVANAAAEHEALLPDLLDGELILGTITGSATNSFSVLATASNPSGAVTGAGLLGWAEHVVGGYETIIMVPSALFPAVAEFTVDDAGVRRTVAGNAVVPQSADDSVYIVPAGLTLHLSTPEVSPSSYVVRHLNDVEAQSTIVGLYEFRADEIIKFDPTP